MRSLAFVATALLLVLSACGKKKGDGEAKGSASPVLPKDQRHYLWIEELVGCPGNHENMLAHHLKIKVDEGTRSTVAHLVRAPVKTYEGLNLIVEKRPHKVEISFGQCNARSDDPQFRCEDDTQITWYAKETVDVDPAKHQTVPFTPPPKLACLQGEATRVSLVAKRPGSGSAASH